jgi:hypothetical protein
LFLLESRNVRNGPGIDQEWTRNDIGEIHQFRISRNEPEFLIFLRIPEDSLGIHRKYVA